MEKYLDMVTDKRYRTAITRLRTSSHTLEIELGRYTIPRTPVTDRLCCVCKVMEDEEHFLVSCEQYAEFRDDFFKKVAYRFNSFTPLSDHEKYIFLMKTDDPYIVAWLGKHIAQSCQTLRNTAQYYMIYRMMFLNLSLSDRILPNAFNIEWKVHIVYECTYLHVCMCPRLWTYVFIHEYASIYPLTAGHCHGAGFVIAGGTVVCLN